MSTFKTVMGVGLLAGAIGSFFYFINPPKVARPLEEVIMQTVKVPKVCDSEVRLGLTTYGNRGYSQPLIYCKNTQRENLVCYEAGQMVNGKYLIQFNCYKLEHGGK